MENTYLNTVITTAEFEARYDAHAKRVLKDKGVLASILINVVPEFSDYSLEEAKKAIEGDPKLMVEIEPNEKGQAIRGMENESNIPGEGKMYFDVVFVAVTRNGKKAAVYINVEAQKFFYPGYNLVSRSIIYCSRLISKQMGIEYTARKYDGVKKVYSIWVCINPPKKNREGENVEDTIFSFPLGVEIKYSGDTDHTVTPKKEGYDILEPIFICLGKNGEKSNNRIIGLLSTIFSETKSVEEKKQLLKEVYGLEMNEEFEQEVAEMCNISGALSYEIREELAETKAELAEKDEIIAGNKVELAEKDEIIAENAVKLAEKDEKIAEKDEKIAEKDAMLAKVAQFLKEEGYTLSEGKWKK